MFEAKNIKKMSRKDLLELLVLQSKKIDELQEKLNKANDLLASKQIMISEAGSIAEASLKLNKIFELAQQAADQYLDNIKRIEEERGKIKQIKEKGKKKSTTTKTKKNKKLKKI